MGYERPSRRNGAREEPIKTVSDPSSKRAWWRLVARVGGNPWWEDSWALDGLLGGVVALTANSEISIVLGWSGEESGRQNVSKTQAIIALRGGGHRWGPIWLPRCTPPMPWLSRALLGDVQGRMAWRHESFKPAAHHLENHKLLQRRMAWAHPFHPRPMVELVPATGGGGAKKPSPHMFQYDALK